MFPIEEISAPASRDWCSQVSGVSGVTRRAGEILRFENEKYSTVYFFGRTGLHGEGEPGLLVYTFEKRDGKYSNVVSGNLISLYPDYLWANYKFDLESTVAYDIAMGSAIPTFSTNSLPNDGAPTYVGISLDPAVKNLRIMGRPPTEIVQFDVQGSTCYVWVYKGLDVAGYLKKSKDIGSGSFTLGKLIDVLDIHFASSDDPLSKEVTITVVP